MKRDTPLKKMGAYSSGDYFDMDYDYSLFDVKPNWLRVKKAYFDYKLRVGYIKINNFMDRLKLAAKIIFTGTN